ncbi:hypothetical protein K504DRAFT_168449 [Pleomassaria siparia CBS 279.74]|uniref:Uncharacterized protein n=1 Tax=Pleomassaria siparia CBS 279.74 TaxID=1314801 RepID=A0A6G1JUJ0_9PLEO|nr:hypothetical protein K504DRAFT_168449 [Pleomassaria siparia CBS 279.74]
MNGLQWLRGAAVFWEGLRVKFALSSPDLSASNCFASVCFASVSTCVFRHEVVTSLLCALCTLRQSVVRNFVV